MRLTRLHILFFSILAAIMSLISCNTSGCLENRSSIPLAEFYSSEDNSALIIDSVAIGGIDAPNDSLLLKVGVKASSIYLPLRSTANNVKYFIAYRWTGCPEDYIDTLDFTYTSIPYFASEECGAMYRYRITKFSYTKHLIDSIAIIDSLVTNANVAMMKIYYPTSDNGEEGAE